MLPAEAGEDGGDAGHQLGDGGPPLRLRVPALDHHRVAGGRGKERRLFPDFQITKCFVFQCISVDKKLNKNFV